MRSLRADFPGTGAVLQSYLFRTESDASELVGLGSRVRLVKGAYREPASVAHQHSRDVDQAYVRCLKILMEGAGHPMIGSHDPQMIDRARELALQTRRAPDSFEFQMLYGIRPNEQVRLRELGHIVRVYVPYGPDWYGYFMRRLAERPANLAFFFRANVTRG
jgi:proline dehydrogenase